MKKLLSIVLSLVMVMTMLPTFAITALATGYSEGDISGTTGLGTKSSPVVVNTFAEFKAAMESWDVSYVKLLATTESLPIIETYQSAITVNGPDLSKNLIVQGESVFSARLTGGVYDNLLYVNSSQTLNISGTGSLSFSPNGTGGYNCVVRNEGVCNITDATLIGSLGGASVYAYAVANRGGNLNISSGTYIGSTAMNGHGPYSAVRIESGNAIISGGTFQSDIYPGVTVDTGTNALAVEEAATCVLTGGEFTSGIYVKNANISSVLGEDCYLIDKSNVQVSASQSRYNKWCKVKDPSLKYSLVVQNGTATVSGTNTPVTGAKEGTTIMIEADDIAGKKFTKWEIVSGGDFIIDTLYVSKAHFTMPANNVTIRAVYEDISNMTFSLSVEFGTATVSGTNTPATNVKAGTTIMLEADEIVGERFTNWEIVSGGGFVVDSLYTKRAFFTMPANNVSIRAVYEAVYVTLSFEANGGTGTMNSVTLREGTNYNLPTICNFDAPAGKEFGNKWIVTLDGQPLTLSAGYPLSAVADTVLKPVWVDKKYTISYEANGGTGTMSPVRLNEGAKYVIPTTCEFVAPAGKVFANKWIVTIDGESLTLNAGHSLSVFADIILKPVWADYAYTFDKTNGIITIKSNGAMPEMAYDEFPWYGDKALIKEVIIGEGVTSISANAFSDCSNITKVTLPSTLKSLSNAFVGTGITTITVPEGVTDIDAWALYNCNSLREIILPSTIKNIGSMALYVSNPALVTVRYNGTESDWAKINIDSSNNITKQGKIIYKHNHTGGTATCQTKAICSICGEAYGSFGTHTYTVEKVAQVNATCTATGTTAVMQCSHCTATTGGDVIPKAAHKYASTYTVDKKATATADGSKSKHCVNCTAKTSVTVIKKVSNINLSTTKYTYDGKVKSPTLTVKDSAGKALVKGTDYTVTTPSGRKNVGKYTYKITFKGSNYSGTKSLSITINPKGTSISSLTASSKGFTVKWKKQATQTTGYQVRYSLKSDMSSATTKTYSGTSTVSKKIGSLKASKKYYVQVRTYKTVNGTKYYSSWSAKKYVTTKK